MKAVPPPWHVVKGAENGQSQVRNPNLTGISEVQGYLAYKKQPPLGPYSRTMSRARWWPYGGGLFITSEATLYLFPFCSTAAAPLPQATSAPESRVCHARRNQIDNSGLWYTFDQNSEGFAPLSRAYLLSCIIDNRKNKLTNLCGH